MTKPPRIAALFPDAEVDVLLTEEDLRKSRAAMERALYDALKRSDPGLAFRAQGADGFAAELQDALTRYTQAREAEATANVRAARALSQRVFGPRA